MKLSQGSSHKLCEFCPLLGFEIVLQNPKRLILRTADNKYIIKVFSDASDKQVQYFREKLYYQLFSPYEYPHLVYSDDEDGIIVTENLRANGLIPQFEFFQETDSKSKLLAAASSSAKGLAKHHQQTYYEALKTFDNIFPKDGNFEIYEDEEFERSTIENRIHILQSAGYEDIVPSIECFEKQIYIKRPLMVLNHGDYIPWNLFVEQKTGELKAVTDGEWMAVASLTVDFAKAIRGLIDARKNNPVLIRNIYDIVETFVESYISSIKENRSKIISSMPYYLGYTILDAAFIANTKWQSDLWTRWHLELVNYFLNIERSDLKTILDPFSVESHPIELEWVGDLEPSIGSETTVTSGDTLEIYVSTYASVGSESLYPTSKSSELSPIAPDFSRVVGSNIAAQIWSNVHGEWQSFPMEFVGYDGNNYRFAGKLSPDKPGKYEFTARISGDGGETWRWAGERKQNATLICE